MNSSFEFITSLQYCLKAATAELAAFKSGEKYKKLQEDHQKELHHLETIIRHLHEENSAAHTETAAVRDQWFEVFEDLEKEYKKKLDISRRLNKALEKRALDAERKLGEAQDKIKQQRLENYELATALEDEKGKNLKLTAQINRDYENSSLPSSKSVKHKKISNSREKTGRKPGGQPGHPGYLRKKQTPTAPAVLLPPPQEVLDDPDFKKTKRTISKQLISVRFHMVVTEFQADEYYNSKTGERRHAEFPEGVVDDVNYAGNIKAFLFLLNNDCCVSIDKSRKFLSDLTDGKLNISKGMINRLSHEFASKTEEERKKVFADMLLSPVMHTDCTNARVNGKSAYVFVCATPDGNALFFAREKKGHEGIKGTPVEEYQGTLIHDHEKTFYSYGSNHQECLAHVSRYLKDSIDNEKNLTWSTEMRSLVREMIHARNILLSGEEFPADTIAVYEAKYKEVLAKAKGEYADEPPSKYFRDGYNLYRRMEKYMSNHLLFLHDLSVPTTNNEAERLLRSYKRKQVQAVSFRSQESIDDLCQCMGVLLMMRQKEEPNIFQRVAQIFG